MYKFPFYICLVSHEQKRKGRIARISKQTNAEDILLTTKDNKWVCAGHIMRKTGNRLSECNGMVTNKL